MTSKPRVVIVGSGFGGLNAARALAKAPVQITIVDRKNFHTFQPLLYQVATAGLSPGEIAAPIRSIFRSYKNIEVLMGEVAAPRGLQIGLQRDAFRRFMLSRHLRPSEWARAAGVPAGEILGFLTGKARSISPAALEKLARAANCTVEELFC